MNEETEYTLRRKKAVALRYDREKERAPRVTAAGKGYVADRIIEIARAHGIVVREDKELVELLSHIELYDEIPVELYQVVAEVLAFVYRLQKDAKGKEVFKK
jgi:flagellar biosynthesis protein